MVNPSAILKIKVLWDQFTNQHPKFPLFLKAISAQGLKKDTLVEIKVTTLEGETYQTNIKVTETDLELFETLKQMNA